MSAQALPPIDLTGKESIDPRVERATNKLGDNVRQSTERITDKVEDLVEESADKASRQFKHNMSATKRPAEGLDKAIERTILKDAGDALETK